MRSQLPLDRRLPPRRSSPTCPRGSKRMCKNPEVLTYDWSKTGGRSEASRVSVVFFVLVRISLAGRDGEFSTPQPCVRLPQSLPSSFVVPQKTGSACAGCTSMYCQLTGETTDMPERSLWELHAPPNRAVPDCSFLDLHHPSQEHVPQPCDTILRPERSSALRPLRPHTSGPKRPVRLDSPFAADFLNHFKASEKFFFTEPSLFIRSG